MYVEDILTNVVLMEANHFNKVSKEDIMSMGFEIACKLIKEIEN